MCILPDKENEKNEGAKLPHLKVEMN